MNEFLQKISKDNVESLLSDIKMTDQLERDFMKKHDMEPIEKYICERLLFQHSPIIYTQGLQKESLGTSIYIQFLDQKYILTAGHIFTGGRPASEDSPNKLDFSKFFIGNGISFKDFKSGIICPPLEEANYQEWDYALLVVDKEIAQTLDQCYTPFQITPNTINERYSPQYGFLYGYPVSKNKSNRFKKKADTNTYICIRTPLDLLFYFQNSGENIGFTCNRKVATIGEIRKNQKHTLCELNGMSGCGIWAIPDYPFVLSSKQLRYTLCGLLTHYCEKEKRLIGFAFKDIIIFLDYAVKEIQESSSNSVLWNYRRS